jgi:hypothetical protein
MKNTTLILAAVLALAAPLGGVAPAFADSSTDRLCGPDAPDGYKRPGGYCDQIDNKGSLVEDKDCDHMPVSISMVLTYPRMEVAAYCYVDVVKVAV